MKKLLYLIPFLLISSIAVAKTPTDTTHYLVVENARGFLGNCGFLDSTFGQAGVHPVLRIGDSLYIFSGQPGLGKVLTSDDIGYASWQDISGVFTLVSSDSFRMQQIINAGNGIGPILRVNYFDSIIRADTTCYLPCDSYMHGWNLTGNSGTNPGVDFLGTTDLRQFRIRCNNHQAMQFKPNFGMEINLLDTSGISMFRASSNGTGSAFAVDLGDWGNMVNGTRLVVDVPTKYTTLNDSVTDFEGRVKIVDGTQSNGYVLTSDATGLGSWQVPVANGATGGEPGSPYLGQLYYDTTLVKMKFWNGTVWAVITSTP